MTVNPVSPIKEIALQHPAAISILEELGIDYCCHGERPLKEACTAAQVSFERVIVRIELSEEAAAEDTTHVAIDWQTAPLKDLAAYIVNKHHAYVNEQAAAIKSLLANAVAQHGSAYEELFDVQDAFRNLADELTAHMFKEELILFPYVTRLERAAAPGQTVTAPFDSVRQPIFRMIAEHDSAAQRLQRIRALTGNYQPPDRNCMVLRTLYSNLKAFEADLHLHTHLENNILFPRAVALESARASAPAERDSVCSTCRG
jgi:regulator of cell morphogenesis and NO signaling